MQESIQAHLERYLQEQSPESFLQLRDAVAASSSYAPYSDSYVETAHSLLKQEKFEEAIDYLMSMMLNWFLNPGIHKLVSFASHKLSKSDDAQFEYTLAMLFLKGILSTGDGSETRPYLVLHIRDEYDVLEHLGKEPVRQSLVNKGNRHYDRQDCKDGSQIWFDVTTPHGYLERRFMSKK